MTDNKTFNTSDLILATVLSLAFPIMLIDRSDSSRVEFVFENSLELNNLVEAFWKDELSFEPKSLYSQLRVIKARIYDKR